MLLKLAEISFCVGGACVFFFGALFSATGVPEWAVALHRMVFQLMWVPFVLGTILLAMHHARRR